MATGTGDDDGTANNDPELDPVTNGAGGGGIDNDAEVVVAARVGDEVGAADDRVDVDDDDVEVKLVIVIEVDDDVVAVILILLLRVDPVDDGVTDPDGFDDAVGVGTASELVDVNNGDEAVNVNDVVALLSSENDPVNDPDDGVIKGELLALFVTDDDALLPDDVVEVAVDAAIRAAVAAAIAAFSSRAFRSCFKGFVMAVVNKS
jgi:hypothetical protein